MTNAELQSRYIREIDRRGSDDRYIDGIEERELMQIAIQHGFPIEQARSFVIDVCQQKGYVIEAAVIQSIREKLNTIVKSDRTILPDDFEKVVDQVVPTVSQTTRSRNDIRILVNQTVEDVGYRLKRSWWNHDWIERIKKRLGLSKSV